MCTQKQRAACDRVSGRAGAAERLDKFILSLSALAPAAPAGVTAAGAAPATDADTALAGPSGRHESREETPSTAAAPSVSTNAGDDFLTRFQ